MKRYLKWMSVLFLLLSVMLMAGCSSQPDPVEDPLSAFDIDAVLPFATVAPEAVMPEATPAPTTNPDDLVTDPTYGQDWKEDDTVEEEEDIWDDFDEPDPTQTPVGDSYQRLAYGDSGTQVKNLQRRLKALGYYSGSLDGQYGAGTVSAVKLYQSVTGLSQSGVATPSLQEEIFSDYAPVYTATPTPRPTPTPSPSSQYEQLERGDSGSRVTRLQNRLKTLGYYTGTADGVYGSGTVNAVKKFQQALGLSQTGVASATLQRKLFSSSAPYYEEPDYDPDYEEEEEEEVYVRLALGSSGSRVRQLQSRLKALGYYVGSVDGAFGDGTARAVERFQRTLGLKETGVATAALQRELFSANAPVYEGDAEEEEEEEEEQYTTLSPGDSGSKVKNLQRRLKELGYFNGDLGGNYLTKTTDAVKKFQRALGLKETGIATPSLQQKLFSANAPYYEEEEEEEPIEEEYVKLQSGSKGDRVRQLQKRLKELGYFTGNTTATYGTKTIEAVKAFEIRYGKEPTGVATVALQKELFSDDALPYEEPDVPEEEEEEEEPQYTTLQKGDSGSKVKKLQRRLKELGYFEGSIGGNYQKLTTDAVKLFQTAVGLKANGVATVETQQRLYADDAPIYSPQAEPTPEPYITLRLGDEGPSVQLLQQRLLELGYIRDEAEITWGLFDEATMLAVIDAQNERGYDSNGEADEEFLVYIYSEDVWDVVLADYEGG